MPEPTLTQLIQQIQTTPRGRVQEVPEAGILSPQEYYGAIATAGNIIKQQELDPAKQRLSALLNALQLGEATRHNVAAESIAGQRAYDYSRAVDAANARAAETKRRNDYLYKPVPITGIPENLRGSIPSDFEAPMAWQRNVAQTLVRMKNALNANLDTVRERNVAKIWAVNLNLAKSMEGLITQLTKAESAGSSFGDVISAYIMSKPEMQKLVGDTKGQALLTLDQRKEYLKHLKAKRDLYQQQADVLMNTYLRKYLPPEVAADQNLVDSIALGNPGEMVPEPPLMETMIPSSQTVAEPSQSDALLERLLAE